MRLAYLSLLPLASLVSASLATDSYKWAADLISTDEAQEGKHGDMVIMDSWNYVDCGSASDAIQIKNIKVSPDPPQPGKNLTVNVEADVLKTIEDGAYADVTVKLGLIKLLQKQFDVCEEAKNNNVTVQCPVVPGPYEVTQTVELPKEIPRAKFTVQVRGYTDEDADMLCLDLFIDFMKRPGGGR